MPRVVPSQVVAFIDQLFPERNEQRGLHLNMKNTKQAQLATQTRLAKDFRNLIHPGRAQRQGQTCDRATALSAVAAVEHIVRCLTP